MNCMPLRAGRNRSFVSQCHKSRKNSVASAGPLVISEPPAQNSPTSRFGYHGSTSLPHQNLITRGEQSTHNADSILPSSSGVSPTPPPSSSHTPPHTEGFSLYSITSLHHNPDRAQNWKERLHNSQLNMGLMVVGHLQAIQRKTTRGNNFNSGFTSM